MNKPNPSGQSTNGAADEELLIVKGAVARAGLRADSDQLTALIGVYATSKTQLEALRQWLRSSAEPVATLPDVITGESQLDVDL